MLRPSKRVVGVALGLLVLAGIAGARYVMRDTAGRYARELPRPADSVRGEVMRTSDGRLHYFDGRQWTDKPVAPTDLPF